MIQKSAQDSQILGLKKHEVLKKPSGPVVVIVADGIGHAPDSPANAVTRANTPTFDRLSKSPLFRTIAAHGTAVGMPTDKDMGNSEVGHNALGAGRIFDQGATLVNTSIQSGRIWQRPTWKEVVQTCSTEQRNTLHLLGLHSDGNVHAHIDHLHALLKQAAKENIETVRLHLLLDGRDTAFRSALGFLAATEELLQELNTKYGVDYAVASGGGRMRITMDRYNADWEMVKRGYLCHVHGQGQPFTSAKEAIETFYNQSDKGDQYLDPFVITSEQAGESSPIGLINTGDFVLLTNFRGDRAIEISQAFEQGDEFSHFSRSFEDREKPEVHFAAMLEYDADRAIPKRFLVDPPQIDATIGHYLATENMTCFAISETQKYGHVTYFWNGNRSGKIAEDLETYIEIPSDNVEFDTAPEMKAAEIADKAIELIKSGHFDWGRINFANGDMVGHTGNFDATVTAVEATDKAIGRVVEAISAAGGIAIVLADHGNADSMFTIDKDGKRQKNTSHTLAAVPLVMTGAFTSEIRLAEVQDAGLANVAATVMNLLGFQAPPDYEPSLIVAAT